jgi:hypothetical protein
MDCLKAWLRGPRVTEPNTKATIPSRGPSSKDRVGEADRGAGERRSPGAPKGTGGSAKPPKAQPISQPYTKPEFTTSLLPVNTDENPSLFCISFEAVYQRAGRTESSDIKGSGPLPRLRGSGLTSQSRSGAGAFLVSCPSFISAHRRFPSGDASASSVRCKIRRALRWQRRHCGDSSGRCALIKMWF